MTSSTPSRWALASLCLTMLMPSLDTSIANAGLPALAHALGASFAQVQWVVLAYLLAITTLIVSTGRLGDVLGRRRVLAAGIALFTLASLLCGAATSLALLVAARALQGLGAAAMLALAMALVGETIPKERTGAAMGLLGTLSAVGTTLGPSLGGLLIAGPGWRWLFLINVPLGLVNLALAWRFLPAPRVDPSLSRSGLDLPGTVLLATTLGAWALAMTHGAGRSGLPVGVLLALALVAALLFIAVEARSTAPLIRLSMLRDPALGASLAMSALVSTVIMSTLVVGPFYLSRALGLPAALAGVALSAGPMVSALTGAPAGRLVDRLGASRMSIAGLAGMASGAVLLALLPARLGVPAYLGAIVVMTIGYATFQAANNTALMSQVGASQRGVVAGMLSLSRNLGLITGASAMGAVFAAAASAGDIAGADASAVARGLHATFAVGAGLIGVALAIAIGARLHQRRSTGTTRQLPV
jgi:EmrB/QacA subfamily drug resistance transporter